MSDYNFDLMKDAMVKASRATWLVRNDDMQDDKWSKEDKTPVTIADLASQSILLSTISQIAPGEMVIAEEESDSIKDESRASRVREIVEEVTGKSYSLQEIRDNVGYRGEESDVRWFVDPLDGTKGFVKGLLYAVGVGRSNTGELTHSWLSVPGREDAFPGIVDHLFWAEKGKGAFVSPLADKVVGKLIERNVVNEPEELLVVGSRAHGGASLPQPLVDAGIKARNIPVDSQAKYIAVATGAAHIYPRNHSPKFGKNFAWDHVPGVLIVEETGGKVTDLTGKDFDWTTGARMMNNTGIFAAGSPDLHKKFIELLREEEA